MAEETERIVCRGDMVFVYFKRKEGDTHRKALVIEKEKLDSIPESEPKKCKIVYVPRESADIEKEE